MELMFQPFGESMRLAQTYVVVEPSSKTCTIFNPMLAAGVDAADSDCIDFMLDWIRGHELVVRWILDPGARHPDAVAYLKSHLLCAQACASGNASCGVYDRELAGGELLKLGGAACRAFVGSRGSLAYGIDGLVVADGPEAVCALQPAVSPETRVFLCRQGACQSRSTCFGSLAALATPNDGLKHRDGNQLGSWRPKQIGVPLETAS
jgi:hypothetical protein